MQMALGMFLFGIKTLAYQTLEKQTSWRHGKNDRVQARAAYQFLGAGEQVITLPGWIAPGQVGSSLALTMIEDMGNTGKAYTLVDGLGFFHGAFIIQSVAETGSLHNKLGQATKIEFNITLERIDEDLTDGMLGDLSLPRLGPSGMSVAELL